MRNFHDLDTVVDYLLINRLPKVVNEFGYEEDLKIKYKWLFDFASSHSITYKTDVTSICQLIYHGITFNFIDINKLKKDVSANV